jgi:hypothetical protein
VAEVIYSVGSEFFFMAKGGTHATNQRISIGGKVVLKMKDDSHRMLSSLLEGDYHVIMTDAMTQARAKDLPVREKKSASWSKTTHLHPANDEVLCMSEAEAITDFVGWLRELKDRFSNAKHVLRGHYATRVDFPALALLAWHHCDYDLQNEFVWEDSKHTLPAAYSGISGALQNILAFEGAIAKPGSAVAIIFAHECEHHLAHKSAAFDAICEMVLSFFMQERRKVDTTDDRAEAVHDGEDARGEPLLAQPRQVHARRGGTRGPFLAQA